MLDPPRAMSGKDRFHRLSENDTDISELPSDDLDIEFWVALKNVGIKAALIDNHMESIESAICRRSSIDRMESDSLCEGNSLRIGY